MTNQEEVYMSKLANFHMVKPKGMCFCTRMCFCARARVGFACVCAVAGACVFSAGTCVFHGGWWDIVQRMSSLELEICNVTTVI